MQKKMSLPKSQFVMELKWRIVITNFSFQFKNVSPFQNWDDKNTGQEENPKFIDEIYKK